jgi:hypothetical protein
MPVAGNHGPGFADYREPRRNQGRGERRHASGTQSALDSACRRGEAETNRSLAEQQKLGLRIMEVMCLYIQSVILVQLGFLA